jgi:hypothetical protein
MATVFAAVIMAAVSVAEALVTGASEAIGFGLLALRRLLSRLLWLLLPATEDTPCYLTVYGTTYCY